MTSEYFSFYLLSYFDQERATNISQILHVFHAKRTPSMFYRIERNNWHAGFGLSAAIQREQLKQLAETHMEKGWLREEEKGCRLTESGQAACSQYFSAHYYPKEVTGFSYASVRMPFWNRLQLFVQVFSELSHQNKAYIPVIKHPHHQENVRSLFQQFGENRKGLMKQWVREQSYLFEELEEQQANVLANLLTGHDRTGKTTEQVRTALQMEKLEFHFYLNDALEVLIQTIKRKSKKVPLVSAILETLMAERNLGLSASTKQTFDLLKAGHALEQIAEMRKVKVNTVREHVLEIAFVFDSFPYTTFVPEELYRQLNQQFAKKENYTYKEAIADFESIEFMYFRLVELERMRQR